VGVELCARTRPWVESPPIPALTTSVTETVEFPDEQEDSTGLVCIAWRGPRYEVRAYRLGRIGPPLSP
jgi:hypothetical protein